ncbi:hypothetical protein QN277_012730 [Acacia crassicarpa]|uniref:PGG domain-containing protein n=1 Tax=Acacia crassicarpa TaxID=499986 RepID=A0AAE1TDP3_9FABA|nr:hypothetical protein QN277_012730 [Acacia crassicarpa]
MKMLLTTESLYSSTLEGRWEEVVAEYKKNARIHKRPINITNDTALHVAVNDNKDDVVKKLVEELKRYKKSLSALELGNDMGDTPLHCAASRGSLEMCRCIAEAQGGGDCKLIEARNRNQETPLYLAALHGYKDAFLYLYSRCADKTVGPCRRGSDGDTVLHCTIRRDYFELAYEIIHLYKEQIVGSVDEKGTTPLHILANKPSGFESSSNFRWYNKLLYSCIIVEPFMIREQSSENKGTVLNNWLNSPKTQMGYRTRKEADTEDPGYDEGYENVPPTYRTCNILVRALLTFFIGLVFGVFGLEDIRKKKEKHVWCGRILEALWKHKNTAYVGGGSAPQGRPILYASDDDDNQEEEDEEFSNDQEEEEFTNPFDINRDKPGDHGANKERKLNAMGNQNTQEDKKDEQQNQIVPVDQSKQKELAEFLRRLCDGNVKESASKAFSSCCVCLWSEEKENSGRDRRETALFIAAKNGVLEIVKKILSDKPGAIHETNSQGQNVMHVAVEYRQPHVFELLRKERLQDNLIRGVDKDGNTILHVAAKLSKYKPWHIPGSALQMQWEIKWFMYIKDITPRFVLFLQNNNGETPVDIFRKDHENLVTEGTEWLNHTSESCSVVAALIAGVAFATSTTIPGGTQEETGKPYLERHPAFNMFALTSLLALFCSTTSLIMFLAILTSRHQPRDFRKDLPLKLLMGLSTLFVSIASVLVSFSAAFFFVLKDSLKEVVFPLYAASILPITFYAVAQFPLFTDLARAIFSKVPRSSNQESEKLIL